MSILSLISKCCFPAVGGKHSWRPSSDSSSEQSIVFAADPSWMAAAGRPHDLGWVTHKCYLNCDLSTMFLPYTTNSPLFDVYGCKGSSLVRYHLPKMLLLWRNVFPRSQKELEAEKARGDSFTWQVTLEGRAGALCGKRIFSYRFIKLREISTRSLVILSLPVKPCVVLWLTVRSSLRRMSFVGWWHPLNVLWRWYLSEYDAFIMFFFFSRYCTLKT